MKCTPFLKVSRDAVAQGGLHATSPAKDGMPPQTLPAIAQQHSPRHREDGGLPADQDMEPTPVKA